MVLVSPQQTTQPHSNLREYLRRSRPRASLLITNLLGYLSFAFIEYSHQPLIHSDWQGDPPDALVSESHTSDQTSWSTFANFTGCELEDRVLVLANADESPCSFCVHTVDFDLAWHNLSFVYHERLRFSRISLHVCPNPRNRGRSKRPQCLSRS